MFLLLFFALLIGAEVEGQAELSNTPTKQYLVPDLAPDHYRFWLKNHPATFAEFKEICNRIRFEPSSLEKITKFIDLHKNLTFENSNYLGNLNFGRTILSKICSDIDKVPQSCWGYENKCSLIYLMPECDSSDPEISKKNRITWFNQADFGYILEKRREMASRRFCIPDKQSTHSVRSSLQCTKNFGTCHGEHLMVNLGQILSKGLELDQDDLIGKGDIGGWNCDLQEKRMAEELGETGFTQSWYNELKNYHLIRQEKSGNTCDIIIKGNTYFIKRTNPSDMYYILFNFYSMNQLNNNFFTDNQIIIWDNKVHDSSKYNKIWSVFSDRPLKTLDDFHAKTICFEKFSFVMPNDASDIPYKVQLAPGCSRSGLFDAFNKHMLYKLGVQQEYLRNKNPEYDNDLIRITLFSRPNQTGRILNEDELVRKLDLLSHITFHNVILSRLSENEAIRVIHNSDILVGIHGSELDFAMFLPDWAGLIELYNFNDPKYQNLAKLRGLSYFSLDDKSISRIPSNETTYNDNVSDGDNIDYRVEVSGFSTIVEKASILVRERRKRFFPESQVKQNVSEYLYTSAEREEL